MVELEYLLRYAGVRGGAQSYRLLYEGQGKDGGKFMLGLTDPDTLAKR
jgi:hypothetical protein